MFNANQLKKISFFAFVLTFLATFFQSLITTYWNIYNISDLRYYDFISVLNKILIFVSSGSEIIFYIGIIVAIMSFFLLFFAERSFIDFFTTGIAGLFLVWNGLNYIGGLFGYSIANNIGNSIFSLISAIITLLLTLTFIIRARNINVIMVLFGIFALVVPIAFVFIAEFILNSDFMYHYQNIGFLVFNIFNNLLNLLKWIFFAAVMFAESRKPC